MSDEGIYRLYKLHQVDAKLHQLKSRGGALDVGAKEAALYKKIAADSKPLREKANQLTTKLHELENRRAESKIKADNFETKLYSGSIVNPREVADLQAEVKMLRELDGKLEKEIAEIKPAASAAEAEAALSKKQLAKLKKTVEEKQTAAKAEHAKLHEEYLKLKSEREGVAKQVDAASMREYEAARKKTGNTGLALITEGQRCEACGIDIPEKTLQMVTAGKLVHCESCRRVLFVLVHENV